jgi:hypothetical protein
MGGSDDNGNDDNGQTDIAEDSSWSCGCGAGGSCVAGQEGAALAAHTAMVHG